MDNERQRKEDERRESRSFAYSILFFLGSLALIATCAGTTGCAPFIEVGEYTKVRYIAVEPKDLPKVCDRLIGRSGGCASKDGDVWVIYAPRPSNVRDARAMEVIGHEFYCHAWLKQSHTDNKGVRREPGRDCVPEEG